MRIATRARIRRRSRAATEGYMSGDKICKISNAEEPEVTVTEEVSDNQTFAYDVASSSACHDPENSGYAPKRQ